MGKEITDIKLPRLADDANAIDSRCKKGMAHHAPVPCGSGTEMTLPSDVLSVLDEAKKLLEESQRLMGKTIDDVVTTNVSHADNGENVVRFVFKDGSDKTFVIRNGSKGADADIAAANAATAAANTAAALANEKASAADSATQAANTAEAARAAAEAAREEAEADRKDEWDETNEEISTYMRQMGNQLNLVNNAEIARKSAETARVNAEASRVNAESERSSAEQSRVSAENSRVNYETNRGNAEMTRQMREEQRQAAEQTREANEAARQSAEVVRQSTFEDNEAARQTTFEGNEAARQWTFDNKESERDAAVAAASQAASQLNDLAQNINQQKDNAVAEMQSATTAMQTQVNTAISGIDAKVDTAVAPIREEVKKLNDLFGNGVEGYVRVSGTSDPAFNYKHYSRGTNVESVFDCLKPCLVGNNFTGHVGEILHVLNPLNWYKDENGDARKIDGSEGEVLICNVRSIWEIAQHVKVGDVTYDVFLRSYTPFEWMGTPASEIKPMGIAPHFCVAHNDEDNVTRMHSAYNMEWNGSYTEQHTIVGKFVQTQNEDGSISETYDADGAIFGGAGGLHSTDISLINGEQYAMNINEDTTKTYPYFNATARAEEVMYSAMVAEGGTFDAHNTNLMGSGWCCNDAATSSYHWGEAEQSARNGFRYQKSDGTWVMMNISKRGSIGFNPTKTGDYQYTCDYLNHWRSPWRIMEQQRVMMYAIENNIPELTWFAFEGNKYKWRNVNGFAGPSEGAMTCVLWKIYAGKFADGMTDPTNNLDVSGLRCEYIICSAIYRGRITDVSPSWWTSGMIFTEDSNGTYEAYMQRDQRKLIKSIYSNRNEADAQFSFEKDYDHVGTFAYGSGYRKDYNDSALMLPSNTSVQNGGGLHTYVGGYNYINGSKPSAGVISVRGFRRGLYANYTDLSPLYVSGNNSPSNTYYTFAFGICCAIANCGS